MYKFFSRGGGNRNFKQFDMQIKKGYQYTLSINNFIHKKNFRGGTCSYFPPLTKVLRYVTIVR